MGPGLPKGQMTTSPGVRSEKGNNTRNESCPDLPPSTHSLVLPMFSPAAQAPTKRYRCIVADPPWHYDAPAYGYGADANYSTMTQEQLLNMPVGLWALDNAHLYLWVTNSFLAEGLQLVKAWGFKYKLALIWIKRRAQGDAWLGMGTYFRVTTEYVLFGVRGSLGVLNHDQPNFFYGARGAHSEKPAAFYDIVQHMSPGPYLDVFARKQRFNWDTWGDEAFNFETDGVFHDNS